MKLKTGVLTTKLLTYATNEPKQNCPYVYHEGIWEKTDIVKGRYNDSLHAGRIVDRIPVTGEIFSTSPDRPWSPLGVKRPERGVERPPSHSAEVKERVDLYLYSPSGPSWPVQAVRSIGEVEM
jgi:hypothetical protein